jgi:hypothetical protein
MINYRVQNIVALVNKLRENGVTIVDTIVTYITVNLFTSWTMKETRLNFGNRLTAFSLRWEAKQPNKVKLPIQFTG